jgi:hypothetical protein
MKKKDKTKGKSKIKNLNISNMLRQVHLGGAINECLLSVKKGTGIIEAVDITNSLIVLSKAKVMSKDITHDFGLGNIELLTRFLSTLEDDLLVFKHNTDDSLLTIKRQDGRRRLNYLLTEPELIATRLQFDEDEDGGDAENTYDKIMGMVTFTAELSGTIIKDFLSYAGMLKQKDVTIKFDGAEKLTFQLGEADNHQFALILSNQVEYIGKKKQKDTKTSNRVNGEHLAKIFSTISYSEESPPVMYFSSDDSKPIVIKNASTVWALLPIAEGEMGTYNEDE